MKTMAKLVTSMAMSGAVVLVGAGVASAHPGGPHGGPGSVSGSITCGVNASLSFSPALMSSAASGQTSNVSLNIQLVQCKTSALHHRTTGHVKPIALGTIAQSTCTVPTTAPPTFSGLGIRWTPPSQVSGSQVSSSTAGTLTTLSSGQAQVVYDALTVAGSFATTSTPGSATLTTRSTVSALQSACQSSAGLSSIAFSGKATL